jgi:DNA-binding Lrp family transcriptional regulator
MEDIELTLISELIKNSHRSDRELAKALQVSQPTITRIRRKLEKEGIIKEYTIIADFAKVGYHLVALTFCKFQRQLTPELLARAKMVAQERLGEIGEAIMLERGIGLNSNGVVVSFHKDYSSYLELKKWLRQVSFIGPYDLTSFIINLDDDVHYRYLTFSTLSKHLMSIMK